MYAQRVKTTVNALFVAGCRQSMYNIMANLPCSDMRCSKCNRFEYTQESHKVLHSPVRLMKERQKDLKVFDGFSGLLAD